MTYEKQLEEQNEELKKLLAEAQSELATMKALGPYEIFCDRLQNDDAYAHTFHCNIAMPIKDNSNLSHKKANELAKIIMKHLFNAHKYNEKYKDGK